VSYPQSITIDVDDDLNRELALYVFSPSSSSFMPFSLYLVIFDSYKQALWGANTARSLAAKHNFPFTRPADYFAEMVKSDVHMERIRQRLLDERAGIKKGEERRKEREGKKFGKQVQIEKLKEREKSKKDMEDRLKSLKRSKLPIVLVAVFAHSSANALCRTKRCTRHTANR
jgi:rRNA-processing protein EBP2